MDATKKQIDCYGRHSWHAYHFFTHSAADLQWPELARLFATEYDRSYSQATALIENPALADWFFYYRVQQFIETFYVDILGTTDYWLRYEWQHRGSPHIHGLAWLRNAPNAEETLASPDNYSQKEGLLRFVDSIVCTCNPAVSPDGSNLDDAPLPRTNPHICSHPYSDIHDYQQDLIDLVATCHRHTRCSTSYCLQRKQGNQVCRFGYPKPLQSQTNFTSENGEVEILTARNDTLVNSYNPVQLSAWRGNVDMKYIVSRHKVIEYCAKYATKCEPRSVPLREVFQQIVSSLKDASTSLTAVQKLLMSVIAERDYSSQETCHLLLQLPMFKASRDFVMLSLDGSRAFEHNSEQGQATTTSILDHYIKRPSNSVFNTMTLLAFAKRYSMPREMSAEPNLRRK